MVAQSRINLRKSQAAWADRLRCSGNRSKNKTNEATSPQPSRCALRKGSGSLLDFGGCFHLTSPLAHVAKPVHRQHLMIEVEVLDGSGIVPRRAGQVLFLEATKLQVKEVNRVV